MKRTLIASLALLVPALASADWRMIVRLSPGATLSDARVAAAFMGGRVADSTPDAPYVLLSLPATPSTFFVAQLCFDYGLFNVLWSGDDASLWSAESVARGATIGVIRTQNDTVALNATALAQVDWSADLAATDGRTVHVAILDNGLSRLQTGLWSSVDASYDAFGGTADDRPMGRDSDGDGVFDESVGHGTMVAGIVHTVAPNVRLIVAKVADSDGRASAWGIVKGLTFAANHGAEVANISLGSQDPVPAFSDAARWCQTKGMLVVAAIGNQGASQAWYPAGDSSALCVAGLDATDLKTSFSNYDALTVSSAPDVGVVSQWWDGGLASWSGTSFASPFVAGAIADCLRRTTPKSPGFLISAVAASGRNVDGVNPASYHGMLGTALDILSLNQAIGGGH